MPTRYKVALGFLYSLVFIMLAYLKASPPMVHWAWVHFGLYWTLAGMMGYGLISAGSVWLVNKINRDWPDLYLPPEPLYSPEIVFEDEISPIQHNSEVRRAIDERVGADVRGNSSAQKAGASQG